MEKYCSSCGAAFNDLKFKICPYCGGKLDVRYGRQPIPRKLRHEVFKRDGYRCRECGASKDETSLEIDHILPVAKGGTNDIGNLQTLCRECNRMKHTDEWVGGETDLEVAQNELKNLEKQLQIAEKDLDSATNDDEKLDYEFQVIKLKDDIEEVNDKIKKLSIISNEKEKESLRSQKLEEVKQIAYKKLYINLDQKSLNALASHFNLPINKSKLLKHAVNYVVEEGMFNQLYANFDSDFLKNNEKLFSNPYYNSYFDLNDNFNSVEDYYNEVKEYVTEEEFFIEMSNSMFADMGIFGSEISKAEDAMKNILRKAALSLSLKKDFRIPIYFLKDGLANISIVGKVYLISDVLKYKISDKRWGDSLEVTEINLLLKDHKDMINIVFSDPSILNDINIGDLIQINDVEINSCGFKNFKKIYDPDIVDQNEFYCKSFGEYFISKNIDAKYGSDSSIIKLNFNYCLSSDEIIEKINSIIDIQTNYEEEQVKQEQIKQEEIQKEIENKKQEHKRKEKLFNELYPDLNDDSISFLSSYYNIEGRSKLIKLLVDNFDSKEAIFDFIGDLLSEKKYESTKKLLVKSPAHINPLLDEIFNSIGLEINSEEEKIKYLAKNYSKRELKILITKSENKVIDAKLKQINESRNKKRKKQKELEIKKQKELEIKKQKELEIKKQKELERKNRIKNYDPSTSKYRVCMNCGYENPKNLSYCWKCRSDLRFQKPIKKELQK